MDLRRRLDQVLQVRPRQKVAEVVEFAVLLVLDIDDAEPRFPASNWLAIDNHASFASDYCKGYHVLQSACQSE